ncbi:hypothetical protein [Rhodococcus sp. JVH1]|uniref:hypothetical protein n=1 Tax=Rhodococcus sp. JVH1 TaxID=745408 RepID=UPI0005C24853|nr:hypothetical protein [Rhodococcus sp. JVH1]
MKPVFSYPTLFGDADLEVLSVSIDGTQLPYKQISRPQRTVALHEAGRANWDIATLKLTASLPESELADRDWTEVVCLAVLSEKSTNSRSSVRLSRHPDGSWQGTIDLSRSRHIRRATLALTVTAEVEGVAGRVVGGTQEPWFIDLTSTKPIRQRDVDIVEEDFRDGSQTWLRPFKDSAWIVDTSTDTPRVYLNTTAVEGLTDILGATGGSTEEKLLRDMAASQIAQDAWIAMFHSAVSALEVDDDGTPIMPTGWRESVLRMMLPDVIPDRQLTDALYEIERQRVDGGGWADVQTRIHFAAGRRSQIARKLSSAVRNIHQGGRSSP